MRAREERLTVAIDERTRRAGAHTGGGVAILEAAHAELALRHERQRLIPLITRNLERAGDHAVTAAHAELRHIDNRVRIGIDAQRLGKAGRGARRLEAVQALLLHEARVRLAIFRLDVLLLDDRPVVIIEILFLLRSALLPAVGQLVPELAGDAAALTADALRQIH